MEFVINGKERELKFDFGFIRELDEKYNFEQNGMKMGFGVNMAYTMLEQYQPDALVDVLKAGVKGATKKGVEKYVEEYAEEHGELEPLFEEIKDEMGKSGMLKTTIEKFKKRQED